MPTVNCGGDPPRIAAAIASAYAWNPIVGCSLGVSATIGNNSAATVSSPVAIVPTGHRRGNGSRPRGKMGL